MSLIWGLQQQSHLKSPQICHLNTRHRMVGVRSTGWGGTVANTRSTLSMEEITFASSLLMKIRSCSFVATTQRNKQAKKLTNGVHASVSWLRSTQAFIPCTQGWGLGGQVGSSRWGISVYSLFPAPAVPVGLPIHPSLDCCCCFFCFFPPNFCCSVGRSGA